MIHSPTNLLEKVREKNITHISSYILTFHHFNISSLLMEKREKRILRNNIIKFLIGLILLGFSYGYVQNHPAEKSSIFSGFEVLWQRIDVLYHQITKTNPEALQNQYNYEQTYQELIKMAESKTCVDPGVLVDLNETLLALKKESIKNINNDLPGYQRKAQEFQNMIENCTKK